MYCIAYGVAWARGRGRDPLGQGPGGPLPKPKMWDTRGECNYLLSGKLPTVRHAPNRSIDLHPTSAYFASNIRILCKTIWNLNLLLRRTVKFCQGVIS